jgi:hypothetical protein
MEGVKIAQKTSLLRFHQVRKSFIHFHLKMSTEKKLLRRASPSAFPSTVGRRKKKKKKKKDECVDRSQRNAHQLITQQRAEKQRRDYERAGQTHVVVVRQRPSKTAGTRVRI